MVDPILLLPLTVVAVLFGVLARELVVRMRERRRARRRVIEQPNSHYDPRAVQNLEARERWAQIRVERVHEINREEVERLLNKADALGVDALKPRERQFLDVMLELSTALA